MGILLAFISMVTIGAESVVAKVALTRINPFVSIFWRGVVICLVLGGAVLVTNSQPVLVVPLLQAFALGIFGYLPVLLFYISVRQGKLGVVGPIAGASALPAIIFSSLIFKESPAEVTLFAALLIIAGGVLLSGDLAKWKNPLQIITEKGVLSALGACICWGLLGACMHVPAEKIGAIPTSAALELGVLVMSALYLGVTRSSLSITGGTVVASLVAMGVLSAISMVTLVAAYVLSPTSVVSPIYSSSIMVVVVGGAMFFGEKMRAQQYGGLGLILVGVILVTLLS